MLRLVEETTKENKISDAETDLDAYDSLYMLIDETKRNIEKYRNIYIAELEGIPKRLKYMKSMIIFNVIVLVLIWIVLNLLYSVIDTGLVFGTFGGRIAFVSLQAAKLYMIFRCIKSILIYLINSVPEKMNWYIEKYDVHNIVEERHYCETILSRMDEYEKLVNNIEEGMKHKTVNVKKAKDDLFSMDFCIKDFPYNAGKLCR